MPWTQRLTSNATVLVSLVLAAALMAFGGTTLITTTRASNEATALVIHSEEVLRTLSRFRENLATITSGQRGFLLTGDAVFMRERDKAIAAAEASIFRLRELVSGSPRQAARTAQMATHLAERIAAARDVAQDRQRAGAFVIEPGSGPQARARESLQQVLALAAAFEAEELALLEQRRAIDHDRQRRASWAIGGSFAAFAVVVLLSYAALWLESRRRRRSERQLAEILDNLPVTVWQMVSAPGRPNRFVYVGPGALRDRGVAADALMEDARLALQNVMEEDRPLVSAAMRAAESERKPMDCTYRIEAEGGAWRWIHTQAMVFAQPDGSLRWTGYWYDISKQKQLEEALREATQAAQDANRAKSTFLATMSHEIRTPLNGVLGLLELLSLTRLDVEQRATLGVVRESGLSLLRIIDDILDFSKVEAGRLDLHPLPASLRDAISRACQVHSGVASSRGLLLEHTVDPRLSPVLVFDPLRVGQILNNFISNALKFTPQGSVRISAEVVERTATTERVEVAVTDTGIGVEAANIDRLFEPFVQADARTWSQFGGTGLGLAISRELAMAMGGDIRMHSTPGVGTRMVLDLTLPIGAGDAVRQDPEAPMRQLTHAMSGRRFAPDAAGAEAEGTLVLVVDDHPTNRMVLSRQVVALGYGVVTAEDGEEALELWRSRRVALVLTDCNMPRRNGYELASAVRSEELAAGRRRTPILGCTASAMNAEAARCTSAGMDACLVKPVDLVELMQTLDRWLPLPGPVPPESAAAPLSPLARGLPFDTALLAMVSGNDRKAERILVREFLQAETADMALLGQAVAARDFDEVRRLGHRVLGAAQSLGAQPLLQACRALDEAARSQDGPTLEADAMEVRLRSAELEVALRARMAETVS